MTHFGDHLIIDCYDCIFETLQSKELIRDCIYDIVNISKMTLMDKPKIYKAEAISDKDKGGYTAFAIITESHISMHSFPFRGYMSIDVYTCKNGLNYKGIEKLIIDAFSPLKIEKTLIKRGLGFPNEDIM